MSNGLVPCLSSACPEVLTLKLNQMRRCNTHLCIIPETVRVMALTATATNTTKSFIIKSLSMQSPEVIYIPPIKNNIIYEVLVKPKCAGGYFKGIVDNFKTKQTNSGRKIMFCKTHRDVIAIYQYFKRKLQNYLRNLLDLLTV